MKRIQITTIMLLLIIPAAVFAIDISASDSVRLDITSRTSFGIDLDNTYRYGLANELTQFDLVFGLAPYQKLSNKLNSPDAVGFIDVTLFNLDLVKVDKKAGYNDPTISGGAPMGTNRYQTGEFLAGIVKDPWLIQLNAAANEPFSSPWNKGLEFINDGFKFSWAYLDSMVDVRRVKEISGVPAITMRGEENMYGDGDIGANAGFTMQQFTFDSVGNIADRFGPSYNAHMVAVMYNADNFGINIKLGTQKPFYDDTITSKDKNGLALGVDSVITPTGIPGLKIFASLMGMLNWDDDSRPDPLFGGTRIGYNIPLNDDLSVEPWAGIDMRTRFENNGGVEDPGYEVSFGGNMRWPGFGGWAKDYILNSDGRVFPGMSLGYKIYEDKSRSSNPGIEHSIKFTLFEPKGDEGLFYVLGSEIIVDLVDLTGVSEGFTTLATAYFDLEFNNVGKIPGTLVPWTILYYDNLPGTEEDSKRINDMKIDIGVNLENAIANTTFGIVWNTGSLIQQTKYHWGYLRLIAEIRL